MTSTRTNQRFVTRDRILTTARHLFRNASFAQVGVREIAAESGVATGTVIAAFGSKGDLLTTIILEDLQRQLVLMQAAVLTADSTPDRIVALCQACLTYQSAQLSIVRASMADSWTHSDETENCVRTAVKPLLMFVVKELERGTQRCEIRPDINLKLTAHMIFDSVISHYRQMIYGDVTGTNLKNMLQERLKFIMRSVATQQALDQNHQAFVRHQDVAA